MGSSHEIDAAEEDTPQRRQQEYGRHRAGGVVALLGLHAGAAVREDHATVRERGRQPCHLPVEASVSINAPAGQ